MSNIVCYDSDGHVLQNLYQQDVNQTIRIFGVETDPLPEIHFGNKQRDETIAVIPVISGESLLVDIPNELLKDSETIMVYIYRQNDYESVLDGGRTTDSFRISVIPKVPPAKYFDLIFMSEDGLLELGRVSVKQGDDGKDPLSSGMFSTPVKPSDENFCYRFDGWSRTIGGDVSQSSLNYIQSERVLYAHFEQTDRLYANLIFMSEDGREELGREIVYDGGNGDNPVSLGLFATPIKEPDLKYTYMFDGWSLEPNGPRYDEPLNNVIADRYLFVHFSTEYVSHTVNFFNGAANIGGRNMLFKTDKVYVSGTDSFWGHWRLCENTFLHGAELEANQTYTLSFDWAVEWGETTPEPSVYVSVGCATTPGGFDRDILSSSPLTSNGEISGKLVLTFTPTAAHLEGRPYFAFRPVRVNAENILDGSIWTISNIKLEKGTQATGWCLAFEEAILATKTVLYGEAVSYDGVPTKPSTPVYGYAFAGWSLEPDGVVSNTVLNSVTSDLDLYAQFTEMYQTYNVYFKDGDSTISTQIVEYGNDAVDYIPVKETDAQYSYVFSGWSLTEGGSIDSSALTNITSDRNVYAIFENTVRNYMVKFYNGTSLISVQTLNYGDVPVAPENPTRPGYVFTGWSPPISTTIGEIDYVAQFK